MLETELYGVVELVLSGGYKYCTSPRALPRECTIEVHDPAIWCLTSWGERLILARLEPWRLYPFCHKISKCCSLDDPGCDEFQLKRLLLDVTLRDSSC